MSQQSVPFCCRMVFHCVDVTRFVYQLTCWRTSVSFPVWVIKLLETLPSWTYMEFGFHVLSVWSFHPIPQSGTVSCPFLVFLVLNCLRRHRLYLFRWVCLVFHHGQTWVLFSRQECPGNGAVPFSQLHIGGLILLSARFFYHNIITSPSIIQKVFPKIYPKIALIPFLHQTSSTHQP